MAATTLDQQRAAHAWQCATQRAGFEGYKELAEGAPALLMGSGLMAALAYWQSRDKEHASALVKDLLSWLAKRQMLPADFEQAMSAMTGTDATQYMALTDEVLALLRWLRQFVKAVEAAR